MRYYIYLLLIAASLSSCAHFQYMTVSSTETTKNKQDQLVYENDTLRLTYDFNGKNGPVSINVFNKTSQPLYVNWRKSALIRNEHSYSYFDRNIQFSGNAYTLNSNPGRRFGLLAASSTSFSGSFALPEGVDFIPPGASISKGLLVLGESGPMVLEIPDSIAQQKIDDVSYGILAKYRQKNFDPATSPVQFKSYLTFMLGFNNALEFAQTNDFYISETLDSKAHPENFPKYEEKGDRFFVVYHKE